MYGNQIGGSIPQQIGLLSSLNELSLSTNNLKGLIPSSIGNLGNLTVLYLFNNQLSGSIPQEIGMLRSLVDLALSRNNLTGSIPASIGNLDYLTTLYLHDNQLSESIPQEIEMLRSLVDLALSGNNLTGSIPTSIGNLGNLTTLYLYDNQLSGSIPQEIGMLRSLVNLALSRNNLTGSIPASIGNLGNLTTLYLYDNRLSGSIPLVFNNLTHLTEFDIGGNMLNSHIPEGLCFNGLLVNFTANDNNLIGPIPKSLTNCSSLYRVRLERNQLSGNMSKDFENLNLAANNLSGSIPGELRDYLKLMNLNLSNNRFGKSIPTEIGQINTLQSLDLGNNLLIGKIPKQIGELQSLETLNLSHNEFFGSIPSSFNKMASLTSIDVSYNQLEGPLPNIKAFQEAPFEALKGNKGLCGNATGLKTCLTKLNNGDVEKKGKKVMLLTVLLVFGILFPLLMVLGILMAFRKKVRNTKNKPSRVNHDNVFAIWSYDGKLVYENIIEVTENFSAKYCVGEGGYGTVYRADLPNGQVVAVKKLHATLDDDWANLKGFTSEIHALTEIRHHNIVKLYGYCSHPRHSFLVYEFLEGGSLGKVLSTDDDIVVFDWIKRVNTVKGVANALSYMHHDCFQPIIHRDISSKNVLFDLEYVAHISDFGTARFMNLNSSNWTSFAGTFGYAAPEPCTLVKPIVALDRLGTFP
ncbi:hypothetical protein CsSME_00008154 [Camellia sinensis var. sinensis]